jgi:hypothetical protein
MITVRTAIIVYMGKSLLRNMKCLSCRRGYHKKDKVVVVESIDEGNDGILVSYHEHCAPSSVIDQLARVVNDNRLSQIDKKIN